MSKKVEKNSKKIEEDPKKIEEDTKRINSLAKISVVLGFIITILLVIILIQLIRTPEDDSVKFSKEYTELTEENVFVYRNSDEIIKILEHGTGVVMLGFPECPWCQRYVVYLNEVAMDLGIEKIYYYNIYEDRKNNTETYQKIVSLIEEHLQYDNEGNKRIYVPAIIGVNDGSIVGFDDETSVITEDITPEDYWTDEEVKDLKEKLKTIFTNSNNNICTSCNEE